MSCHSLVRSSDASCGGKKVRQPFVFKITQQHTNNWEVGRLFLLCIFFPAINVSPPGYRWIYNIFSNGGSCVYFVKMLACSLGAPRLYVQCKHVYHILQIIMLYGLTEEFVHYYMWSWDEIQHLLKCFKAFGLSWQYITITFVSN